jgi:general secretion pathway protein B
MPAGVVDASSNTQTAAQTLSGLPLVYELDFPVRHALPKLNLSLHVYDPIPARRFVVINGKRYVEGDTVDAKVQLQQIVRDGIECAVDGTRFLLPRQQ